jgi:hypothetical protein
MLEKEMIQEKGFKNISRNGQITGFQVAVRTLYYRGIWASLLEGADVAVDGEKFPKEQVSWTIGSRTFTVAELANATNVRWPFEEPAVLTINKPGGLKPGFHSLEVLVSFRASYMPIEMQPWVNTSTRKLVLVH